MNLEEVLEREICKEFKKASNHATRQTIIQRVFLKIVDILRYPMDSLFELKNLLKIDRDCMETIEKLWQESTSKASASQDETTAIEKFMSKDYVRLHELGKLFNTLSKKLNERDLQRLLAIDGLSGEEIKYYITNLKFSPLTEGPPSGYEEAHVRAVRRLYDSFPELTPSRLGMVLSEIHYPDMNDGVSTVENAVEVRETYLTLIGDYASAITTWKRESKQKEKRDGGKKSKTETENKVEDMDSVNTIEKEEAVAIAKVPVSNDNKKRKGGTEDSTVSENKKRKPEGPPEEKRKSKPESPPEEKRKSKPEGPPEVKRKSVKNGKAHEKSKKI